MVQELVGISTKIEKKNNTIIKNIYNMESISFLRILFGYILIAVTIIPTIVFCIFYYTIKVIYWITNKLKYFTIWYNSKIEELFDI